MLSCAAVLCSWIEVSSGTALLSPLTGQRMGDTLHPAETLARLLRRLEEKEGEGEGGGGRGCTLTPFRKIAKEVGTHHNLTH